MKVIPGLCKQPLIVSHKNKKTKQIVAGESLYIIQLCFIQTPLQGKELQTYNLQPNRTELYYMYCSGPIRKMSIFLPFQDLTPQCIMPSSSHKRRIWSQTSYFLYPDFQVGRTERLDNTLNPRFSKAVLVDYFFEELQKLKFFIYDIDSPTGNLKTADFLGELECTLGQVRYTLNLFAYKPNL